jgi:hypothetical protein
MKDEKYFVMGLVIILVLSLGCIGNTSPKSGTDKETITTNSTTASAAPAGQSIPSAPVQDAIKQEVANGNLSLSDIDGKPEYSTEVVKKNDSYIESKSTTKLKFKNPKGAGYADDKWPKLQATTDNNVTTDYDKQIKDSITVEIASIKNDTERIKMNDSWNNYSFDSGPRIYEVNETYGATFSNDSFLRTLPNGTISASNYSILMGFTNPIHWTYHKEENIGIGWFASVWGEVYAYVDGALGLRLPIKVRMDVPNMASGLSYTLNTSISGQDWSGEEYSMANVPPENGNEFVLRGRFILTAQAKIIVLGGTLKNFEPININEGFDYGRSFKTPFGPNEKFPIPELILSPDQTKLKISNGVLWVGAGLKFEPILGSTKINAKWYASGDAAGEGPIEYQSPDVMYSFSLQADDYDKSTNYANVKLSNYKYYFNRCILSFDANIQGGLVSVPKFVLKSGYINIYSYNCGNFMQALYLGVHPGTNADGVNISTIVIAGEATKIADATFTGINNTTVMSVINWNNNQTNDTQTNITVPIKTSIRFNVKTNHNSDSYGGGSDSGNSNIILADQKNLYLDQDFNIVGNFSVKLGGKNNTNGWANKTWNIEVISVVNTANITTANVTTVPTENVTTVPTENVTTIPTENVTIVPAANMTPTELPTVTPTPTIEQTLSPTVTPTPTIEQTLSPTVTPTPTIEPTLSPTVTPTELPTVTPTPTIEQTLSPTVTPTPTIEPTLSPTVTPTELPTVTPTELPTVTPTLTIEPTQTKG